jgi:MinD superfamily P-loop ATPase
VDGAPGVGCPVISSVTGADRVLIVTEPTMSGLHDMERAMQLVKGFRIPISVAINKSDINAEIASQIRTVSERSGGAVLGEIPYDPQVIRSMVQGRCVMETGDSPAVEAVHKIWDKLSALLAS